MPRFIVVSIAAGLMFAVLDGLLNANPLGQRLYEVYRPIARPSMNFIAGVVIDLAYGFLMALIFMLLYQSLPGGSGWIKGTSFGLLVWFFRVVMYALSSWVMFKVPGPTVVYTLGAGLAEMLVIGIFYGLTLGKGQASGGSLP